MSTGVRPVVLMPEVATKRESTKDWCRLCADEIGKQSNVAPINVTIA